MEFDGKIENSETTLPVSEAKRKRQKGDSSTHLQSRNYPPVFALVTTLTCLLLAATGALAQNTISVTKPSGFAISPRLIDLPDDDRDNAPTERPHHPLPDRGNGNGQNGDDPARQHHPEPRAHAFPHASFAAVGANGYAPPDTNIAVGPNHIVETVNVQYAVYSKAGALLSARGSAACTCQLTDLPGGRSD